jgi:hypothetical protein
VPDGRARISAILRGRRAALSGALNGGARNSGQRVSRAPGAVPKTPQTFRLNGVKLVLLS